MPWSKRESQVVTAVINVPVPAEQLVTFSEWQLQMDGLVASADGFISTEVVRPRTPGDDFVIFYRFETVDQLRAWMRSLARREKLAELPADLDTGDETMHVFVGHEEKRQPEPITAVISDRVKVGQESEYREWQKRMADVMSQQPGSIGWTVQEPVPGLQDDWVVMARFDSEANLARWLQSPTRAKLLVRAEGMIEHTKVKQTRTSVNGWFHFADGDRAPKAWQQSALVLLVLYPVVVAESVFLTPIIMNLIFSVQMFIGNTISVAVTGFVFIPIAAYFFRWWLQPQSSGLRKLAGALLIVGLYAISIAAMGLLYQHVQFQSPFVLG